MATVAQLKSPLRAIREKQRLPLADAAEHLGIQKTDLERWEKSLEGAPAAVLRDLAIFYEVNVSDLTGVEAPEERAEDWPYALEKVAAAAYGTLKVGFPWGAREYPIDERARELLMQRLARFDAQGEDQRTQWLYAWTMDNRILFINLDHVDSIDLIGDDAEAMPSHEHPEVYLVLEDLDIQEIEAGPILQRALDRILEQHDTMDDAIRPLRHSLTITSDGRQLWHHMLEAADSLGAYVLTLTYDMVMARNAMLELSAEGYYASRYVNLSRAAVIEFPAERYARLSHEE